MSTTLIFATLALIIFIALVIYARVKVRRNARITDLSRPEYHPAYVVITDVDAHTISADFGDEMPTKPDIIVPAGMIECVEAPWPCNCGSCRNCQRRNARMTSAN